MRLLTIGSRHLALLLLPLLLLAGCWEVYPGGRSTPPRDDDRTAPRTPDRSDPPQQDAPDVGDADTQRRASDEPVVPISNLPRPEVRLSKEGGVDSVRWRGRELVAPSRSGRRKPIVHDASLIGVEGRTARFRQKETGNRIDVRLEPVPGGYDVHVTTDAEADAEVHLWLEGQKMPGDLEALYPEWAGHIDELVFPAAWRQEYDYPGRSFAPVIAFWNAERTAGYAVHAQVGDFVRLKVYRPAGDRELVMPRLSLLNGCRAGERLERVITVRYSDDGGDWQGVLEPYRSHQQRRDGSVRYERLGPWVAYNLRNSHHYDEQRKAFEPGSTWYNRLGHYWERALREAEAGRLALGCLGVWSQMEELDRERFGFNPNVTDLEKSLGGSLPEMIEHLRRKYGPVPISAFSRPTRKIEGGRTVTRDLDEPRERQAALALLHGLKRLGFDVAYGDEVGIHGGWGSVDLVEAAPIRVISEWAWDRLITRGPCLMAHANFPRSRAALLVPYLTPGGELYVRALPQRRALFAEGAVTPWTNYLAPEETAMWNRFAAASKANRSAERP
jgi:hypothetical protein